MAEKGWTARVAAAAGAAAGIGAAQLGLGYGLGVVIWPAAAMPDDSEWLGSLGWATWIAASATVFGAVLGSRFGGPAAARLRGPWRFTLAASAAIGALVAVALIALPARAAVRSDTFSPQVIAGGYAVIGLALGLVVAYWAVVSRPVAANLIATAAWLWALAIAAVVVELTLHRTSATYLTSWQFAESGGDHRYGTIYWPSAVLTLGAALLIGVVAAAPAVRRGELGAGTAASGAVGPLLVAAAFFVLAPQLTGALGPLESAYLIAPYAVISGLAGSAMTVSFGQAAANRRARRAAVAAAAAANAAAAAENAESESDAKPADPPRRSRWRSKPAAAPVEKSDDPATVDFTAEPAAAASRPNPDGQNRPGTASPAGPAAPQPPAQSASQSTPPAKAATKSTPAAQPATSTPTAQPVTKSTPAARSATAPAPAARSATAPAAAAAAQAPAPAARRPSPSKATPTAAKSAEPAKQTPARPTPSATTPPRATPTPVSRPPATPQPASGPVPDDVVDAEIAAAARRGRGRPKKAEPAPPKPPTSTVTPPPASPTIAQINPKPPANG